MGGDRVTVKNLIVVDVDKEAGLIAVSGPVPGVPGGLLIIKKLAEGSLEELVEEAPQVEIQQVEPSDADAMEGNGEAGSGNDEKTEGKKE